METASSGQGLWKTREEISASDMVVFLDRCGTQTQKQTQMMLQKSSNPSPTQLEGYWLPTELKEPNHTGRSA